jgi:hypothetical protein
VNHRAHAHHARLNGHEELSAGQAVIADCAGRGPQRDHFGMRSGVIRSNRLVESGADNRPIEDDNGANRYLAEDERFSRLFDRGVHVVVVGHASIVFGGVPPIALPLTVILTPQ